MVLWTMQPEEVFRKLEAGEVYRCDPKLSEVLRSNEDASWNSAYVDAYDWLVEAMTARIGPPPSGVQYPVWAWHTYDGKRHQPDLRHCGFGRRGTPSVCIEVEIPDRDVVLSDHGHWHNVLNKWYYCEARNSEEFDREYARIDALPETERVTVIRKSWDRIFDVSRTDDPDWDDRGCYVQATFWELRPDQVVRYKRFVCR